MGLMDQLGGMLGGGQGAGAGEGTGAGAGGMQQILGRFMGGGANFGDGRSDDHQHFNQMMGHASDDDLGAAFSHAARGVDPNAYREHVTPGASGTDPLGGLGRGGLGTIASALIGQLGGSGGGGMASMLGRIPGLSHSDPHQMSSGDVAALADYTRQNHPDAFGRAAAQVGRQDPGALQQLLGNKAMMMAAAAMASKFLGSRR
jgi:hypothetical protein